MTTMLTDAAPAAADWEALGCLVRLVVTAPDDLALARQILVDELAAIDLACSRFRDDSELARLDASNGQPTPISPLLVEAISAALFAAATTDGDVDPTVGAAISAVGYDRDYRLVKRLGPAINVVRRPVPGWHLIELDPDNGVLTVPAGVRLDLGATAKALASDRAAGRITEALNGRGVLVGLGGDLAAAGRPPADGWTIRVQDVTGPVDAEPDGPVASIALHAGGLATSSTSARRWIRGGRVMHHILDPRTGVPVVSSWRTVTVAAATCLEANIASTASVVRGKPAPAWLTGRGLAARLVDADGTVTCTPGWPTGGAR